jgi:Protein of unknown function (DUF3592)
MKYALYLLISICLLLLLAALAYFVFLTILTLATLLGGYLILLGLLLALAGTLTLRRTLRQFQHKHMTLATITRITLDRDGRKTYQLHFTTRENQTILTDITPDTFSPWSQIRTLFLDLYDAHLKQGSRVHVCYDVDMPYKDPRHLSFITVWLGPILLFWFAGLLTLFGITLWLAL